MFGLYPFFEEESVAVNENIEVLDYFNARKIFI